MNTAEFKSATFPNAGSRHLLDDSVMEIHSPTRGQAESSTLSSGISLGKTGIMNHQMHSLCPNWEVFPYLCTRNSLSWRHIWVFGFSHSHRHDISETPQQNFFNSKVDLTSCRFSSSSTSILIPSVHREQWGLRAQWRGVLASFWEVRLMCPCH